MGSSPSLDSPLADLLACVAAFGRSLQDEFDPQRFLSEFSSRAARLVPHDRVIIDYLEDGGTFTVFAEDPGSGPTVYQGRYTTDFDPGGRYAVDEWDLGPVFAGGDLLIADLALVAPVSDDSTLRARLLAAGVRARVAVPVYAGGRVIGALAMSSFSPGTYTPDHVVACRQIADLIGPFVQGVVLLLHRERRRRERLQAISALASILGASLKVGDLLERLGEALRPILDFDGMAMRLVNADGRALELVSVLDADEGSRYPGMSAPDEYSTSGRIARGETVVIHDAERELDPGRAGDRRVLARGRRSLLIVPLMFGERVDGLVYFAKQRPGWYGEADVEVARALAAQIVIAVQHQRLAEEEQRVGAAEARARHLQARVESLRTALDDRHDFARIPGRAPALLEALDQARKVAPTETTVLPTGESGTGKELVARAIHHASPRGEGPFVAVNCAALPETLIESELFGHERGAFTGADKLQRGRFELAAGGTLLLDEIGELASAVQAKLLRVLQERQYQRVGGTSTLAADVRLIAATNRDLERAVATGRFREDLYYRLAVFRVHLPALRDRGDDVLLLGEHFVRELGAKLGKRQAALSRQARELLLRHRWPGNIRELQNAVERALIVSGGGLITAGHLGITVTDDGVTPLLPVATAGPGLADLANMGGLAAGPPSPPTLGAPRQSRGAPREYSDTLLATAGAEPLAELERRAIVDALARMNGNKSRAAALLGLTRTQLYTRLKRLHLAG